MTQNNQPTVFDVVRLRLSEWFDDRQSLIELIQKFRESFEIVTALVILINLLVIGLSAYPIRTSLRWLSRSEAALRSFKPLAEGVVLMVDGLGLVLITVSLSAPLVLYLDETRLWRFGLSGDDVKSLREWIYGKKGALRTEDVKIRPVYSPVSSDFTVLTELNFKAYRHSRFRMDKDLISLRNEWIISRNPKTFMLWSDHWKVGPVMAYSCILPLTARGLAVYLSGKISDSGLPASIVCDENDKSPSALLIFATAFASEYKVSKGFHGFLGDYVASCLAAHLKAFSSGPLPPLYIQVENRKTRNVLKTLGFVETKDRSADDLNFMVLESTPQK